MEPLDIQLYRVSVMALAGAAAGLLLDIYRIFRWATSPRGFLVYLEDLVFWLILTPLFIFSLLVSNWVDLRLYVFAGFGLGLGSYLLLASPVVILVFRFIVRVLERVGAAVKRAIRRVSGRALTLIRRIRSASRPDSRIARMAGAALARLRTLFHRH
ncbi:MAG: spore cortex biosynthesis protein YabQ [Ignavibacteriales bacterium]